jgi:ATP-dependent DNA helicase RecG
MERMSLPVNLNKLLHGKSVEWERLEFKKGLQPLSIIQGICAFANDFHNLNGGYIILGIKDNNGRPVLPPTGIKPDKIEQIQRELRGKCKRLTPEYQPRFIPVIYDSKNILVIWCPGGQNRPYQAPTSFDKNSDYKYFIRQGAETVQARGHSLNELMQLTAKVPFDDRLNQQYDIDILDKQLIRQFLKKIDSELYTEIDEIEFSDLCRQMEIADKINAHLVPRNVGLMFFTPQPHKYFPTAQIEVVHFRDQEGGDVFEEKIFRGSLDYQIQQTLSHLKSYVLEEKIIKQKEQAEAKRFYNYPFAAVEEIVVNAVYHRGYEEREPIEIRISPKKIEVLSFPGPVRSVKIEDFKKGKVIARRYRNRRIGDFLKELSLSEGRSTGIPKIRRSMKNNGSPLPRFETDKNRTYFLAALPIHPNFYDKNRKEVLFNGDKLGDKLGEKLGENQVKIIKLINRNKNITIKEMSNETGISATAIENNIAKLKKKEILKRVGSDRKGYWKLQL